MTNLDQAEWSYKVVSNNQQLENYLDEIISTIYLYNLLSKYKTLGCLAKCGGSGTVFVLYSPEWQDGKTAD